MARSSKQYPDRLKLPFTYDADKMLAEYNRMGLHDYTYYSVIMMALPAPGGVYQTPVQSHYITGIISEFAKHTDVTLARLLRLAPGAVVDEHCDPMLGLEIPDSVIRLTIPITKRDDVTFFLNQTPVDLQRGDCWYLRLSDQHRITNNAPTERVNMTIDVKPNDWVMSVIDAANREASTRVN